MVRLWWWPEGANVRRGNASSPDNSSHHSASKSSPPRRPHLSSRDRGDPTTSSSECMAAINSSMSNGGSSSTTAPPPSPRRRINSRDLARSYSGLYGFSGDLLPFEMNRQRGGRFTSDSVWFVLACYVTLLAVLQTITFMIFNPHSSWTATNAIHLLFSLIYVHWLKGSLFDDQGELSALTVWEQLEATVDTLSVRRILLVVPTILTYASCHFCDYEPRTCFLNAGIWLIALWPKTPCMNGVRLFGINRTVGIDDAEYDHVFDSEHESTSDSKLSSAANAPIVTTLSDGKDKLQ